MPSPLKTLAAAKAQELGFDLCRVATAAPPDHAPEFRQWLAEGRHAGMEYLARTAPKRLDPQHVLPGARSILILAASYYQRGGPAEASGAPRVARYARFADYHGVLEDKLAVLAGFIDRHSGVPTRSLWHVDAGPVLERDLAQRAGIGFAGKHTNLISRSLGNWFFLCEILTVAELEPDAPEPNRCGHCRRCLDACPTQAIDAPFRLDARRCISYLTIENKGPIPVEFRRAVGNRVFGCDDCLDACPWNRFARESALMSAHFRPDLARPALLEWLALDDAAFKARFAGTPLLRAKRRGLLRNVCVALGNAGNRAALPALERAASDPEPLIAEHARWAIGEIERETRAG